MKFRTEWQKLRADPLNGAGIAVYTLILFLIIIVIDVGFRAIVGTSEGMWSRVLTPAPHVFAGSLKIGYALERWGGQLEPDLWNGRLTFLMVLAGCSLRYCPWAGDLGNSCAQAMAPGELTPWLPVEDCPRFGTWLVCRNHDLPDGSGRIVDGCFGIQVHSDRADCSNEQGCASCRYESRRQPREDGLLCPARDRWGWWKLVERQRIQRSSD